VLKYQEAYGRLFAGLAIEWEPCSTTEWMCVRDLADQTWDVLRWRRAIADILDGSLRPALQGLLEPLTQRACSTLNICWS